MKDQIISQRDRSHWYIEFLVGAAVFTPALVYVVGHLMFSVPSRELVQPMIVFCGLFAIASPLIYWGKFYATKERDYRRMFLALGLLFIPFGLLAMFYGARLGIISNATAKSEATTLAIIGPLTLIAAYYFFSKFVLPRHLARPAKE